MIQIIERLRRVNSPGREVEELTADLSPQTEVDSLVRDFFTRMVRNIDRQGKGPITLDLSQPNDGNVNWEITVHEETGRPMVSIWWTP